MSKHLVPSIPAMLPGEADLLLVGYDALLSLFDSSLSLSITFHTGKCSLTHCSKGRAGCTVISSTVGITVQATFGRSLNQLMNISTCSSKGDLLSASVCGTVFL